jgi:hypothetical protein
MADGLSPERSTLETVCPWDGYARAVARATWAHVVQPHSFWHLLSALSLLYFYRYERSIEQTLRDRRTAA